MAQTGGYRTTTEIDDALGRASASFLEMLIGEQSFEVSSSARLARCRPAIDLSCDLTHTLTSSRRGLALSPTCPARQGGFHEGGMWPIRQTSGTASLRRIRGGSAMATATPLGCRMAGSVHPTCHNSGGTQDTDFNHDVCNLRWPRAVAQDRARPVGAVEHLRPASYSGTAEQTPSG